MRTRLRNAAQQPWAILVTALTTLALWAVWLGWDQHRDIHPDGSTTGPYEAWQVIGLVLTLLVPLYWAASRQNIAGSVLGITAGLGFASFYDWSDDASGLFAVGVIMLMTASLVTTTGVSVGVAALKRR
ncbi:MULTISPECIES: hypothetical protein [unclassified Streptomyces]|uniref:hypothetical protein n=1 Tax=unclassified Streptomyces TaxID=2593676 RepID=UPI00093B23FE|nr:hypothetical protein [Streptomyces sp. CB02058]OKI91701.1 hypothetical protein AMK10_27265 [Streptomyces sp. CB02058]